MCYQNYHYRYKGRIYNTCINLDVTGNGGQTAWCSTLTNSKGEHIVGNEDECKDECAVSNCPIGFYWAATAGTCYQASMKYITEIFNRNIC